MKNPFRKFLRKSSPSDHARELALLGIAMRKASTRATARQMAAELNRPDLLERLS